MPLERGAGTAGAGAALHRRGDRRCVNHVTVSTSSRPTRRRRFDRGTTAGPVRRRRDGRAPRPCVQRGGQRPARRRRAYAPGHRGERPRERRHRRARPSGETEELAPGEPRRRRGRALVRGDGVVNSWVFVFLSLRDCTSPAKPVLAGKKIASRRRLARLAAITGAAAITRGALEYDTASERTSAATAARCPPPQMAHHPCAYA